MEKTGGTGGWRTRWALCRPCRIRLSERLQVQKRVRRQRRNEELPDTSLEEFHLSMAVEALPGFPKGPFLKGEAPDFTFGLDGRVCGIEHTLLHHSDGDTRREREEQLVVQLAHSYFSDLPPMHVFVSFTHDHAASKVDRAGIARTIACTVASDIPDPGERREHTIPWDAAAPASFLRSILVARPRASNRPNWQVTGAATVSIDFSPSVQSAIDAKEPKREAYLQRCDQAWLLIVAEMGYKSAFCEMDGPAKDKIYRCQFDRAFFLDQFTGRAFEIRREQLPPAV